MENIIIHDLTHDGRGVGRLTQGTDAGKTIFVPESLPGEALAVRITSQKKKLCIGVIDSITTPSPDRKETDCSQAATCGGCTFQHATLTAQHQFKKNALTAALERIGKFTEFPDIKLMPMKAEGYRHSVRFHYDGRNLGFTRRYSHEINSAELCLVAAPKISENFLAIQKLCKQVLEKFELENIEIQCKLTSENKPSLHLCDTKPPKLDDDKIEMQLFLDSKTCGNFVVNDQIKIGHPNFTAPSTQFVMPRSGFLQGHMDAHEMYVTEVSALISDYVLNSAKGNSSVQQDWTVWDLYCGAGVFSGIAHTLNQTSEFQRLKIGLTTVGVDAALQAIECAKINVPKAHFIADYVDSFLLETHTTQPKIVIVDPPRDGMGADNINQLAKHLPQNCLVCYVSCSGQSFARDARIFADHGFRMDSLKIFDAYAHTPHFETIACLTRV